MTRRRDVLKFGAGLTVLAGAGSAAGALQVDGDPEEPGSPQFYSAGTLRGEAEVPPVESAGTGATVLRLDSSGTLLHYVVLVARVEDVTQAHIHVGPRDENGPVVAFLFGRENEDGEFVDLLEQGVTENGVLAEGTIEDENLVGPLAGMTVADLAEELESGNAYINVHTEEVPSGEIRGQLGPVDQVSVELTETERIEASSGDGLAAERTVSLQVSQRGGNGGGMEMPEPPEAPEMPDDGDDDNDGNDGDNGDNGETNG